jgi:hypothetical protein
MYHYSVLLLDLLMHAVSPAAIEALCLGPSWALKWVVWRAASMVPSMVALMVLSKAAPMVDLTVPLMAV